MPLIIKTTTEVKIVADFVAKAILDKLNSGKKVLWLVPGGSNIPVAVEAAKIITKQPHQHLTVTLTDERYGAVGHKDSNWQKLKQQGFNLPQAKLLPVLNGQDRATTVKNWGTALEQELLEAQYKIGLLGVGADGHTAGILPESIAVNTGDLTFGYNGPDFERITITPKVIVELDEVVVYVEGEEKKQIIEDLKKEIDINKQPAQILKSVPKLTIFLNF